MSDMVKQADKFRMIHGIGEAREKWLQATLDVYTFRALASLTVDKIERELVNAPFAIARGVERSEIAAWLEEANKLAAQKSDSKIEPHVDKKGDCDWEKDIRFFVEFQTRIGQSGVLEKQTKVHEMETGKEDAWPGHNLDQPAKWMLGWVEQEVASQTRIPALEPRKAAPEVPPTPPTVTFEIAQISVFQPQAAVGKVGVGLPDTVFVGTLFGDVPFDLECHVLVGLENNVASFPGSVPYRLELFATDRETGKVIQLGKVDNVSEKAGLQKVVVTKVCLAGGVYRVEAIVTSPGFPCKPGFIEIPLLRIM